jgi:hypothetical protein
MNHQLSQSSNQAMIKDDKVFRCLSPKNYCLEVYNERRLNNSMLLKHRNAQLLRRGERADPERRAVIEKYVSRMEP